jgi:hypothetical protein
MAFIVALFRENATFRSAPSPRSTGVMSPWKAREKARPTARKKEYASIHGIASILHCWGHVSNALVKKDAECGGARKTHHVEITSRNALHEQRAMSWIA